MRAPIEIEAVDETWVMLLPFSADNAVENKFNNWPFSAAILFLFYDEIVLITTFNCVEIPDWNRMRKTDHIVINTALLLRCANASEPHNYPRYSDLFKD